MSHRTEMSGRVGGQHGGRRRVVRRPGRLHRPGARRRARDGLRPRPQVARRHLHVAAGRRRTVHRPLHDHRHERRAADDEHLPRCVVDALPRPPRPRPDRGVGGDLPRGVPVRPARGQGRLPGGGRGRARRRPEGRAQPVRQLLRRPPPRRLPAARGRGGRHPLRQRGRDHRALRGRHVRRRHARRSAGTARSPASPVARRARSSSPPAPPTRCRPTRSSGWSTPPRPATSTRPASSTATRRAWPTTAPAGSARSPPPR